MELGEQSHRLIQSLLAQAFERGCVRHAYCGDSAEYRLACHVLDAVGRRAMMQRESPRRPLELRQRQE